MHLGFAGCDCLLALDEEAGALDDRHVNHLAVDGDGADPLGKRLVISGEHAAGVIDLRGARSELLVQDRHLARMNDRGADKPETTRAPDRRAKAVEVVKLGDRADKAQRHDPRGTGGEDAELLWHEQPLGLGQHACRQREILGPDIEADKARMGAAAVSTIAMSRVVPGVMLRSASSSSTTSATIRT